MKLPALSLAIALALPVGLAAQASEPPALGAATNFGQSWQPDMLSASKQVPVTDFRDAVYWRDIERTPGAYDFDGPRRNWPDHLPALGAGMSLTVNNGHPAYDGGHTPLSPEAVAAFAKFAATTVTRFPAIHSVEVGNEMNSDTFVSGPGWDTNLQNRAQSYTALLAETARAVRTARPEIRILGGAAHSVPLAWFEALFAAGAALHMDALVIHPYGVAPEHLGALIGQLRTLPEAVDMPIQVTEFGHEDAAQAPDYLLKSYCLMALSGVERVIWYPLNPRGDGLEPLVDAQSNITPVGRTYMLLSDLRGAGSIAPIAPDPFTYGCTFGDAAAVLWGAPRQVTLRDGVRALDALGDPLSADLRLSREAPIVLLADTDIQTAFTLAPQTVLADSVDQFAFDGTGDPFERLVVSRQGAAKLEPRPGQQKNGVPWVPYMASSWDGVLRAGADWVLPSAPSNGPLSVSYRYRAPARQEAELMVHIAPSNRSEDGVDLIIRLGGEVLRAGRITDATTVGPIPLRLRRRDLLEVLVGPGETARGDVTQLRVTLHQPGTSQE